MGLRMSCSCRRDLPNATFDFLKDWCTAFGFTSEVASFALSAGLLHVHHVPVRTYTGGHLLTDSGMVEIIVQAPLGVATADQLRAALRAHCALTGKQEPYGL